MMRPKYIKGQKVKIVSVRDQHTNMKYPELQNKINETGTILESTFIPIRGLKGTRLEGENLDLYMYKVQLDKDGTILENVIEDALVTSYK